MSKTEEFIKKAISVHGNKYDYSSVSYIRRDDNIEIICKIHGKFQQRPFVHLRGSKCPKCSCRHKRSSIEFINDAKLIHGGKYEYPDVNFVSVKQKVPIKCLIHGIFEQRPNEHLNGQGCPKCKFVKLLNINKSDNQKFINSAKLKHGEFYSYSNVEYIDSKTKIIITCPIHGDFKQAPDTHLDGSGCRKCKGRLSTNTKEFIEQSLKLHDGRYSYDNVIYKSSKSKVDITCSIHGNFKQIPNAHLRGIGCPKCNLFGTVSENKLYSALKEMFSCDELIQSYKCKWLGRQHFDIYLPKLKVAIEYQGAQHFKPIKFFGGEDGLNKVKRRDERKRNLCIKHKVKLYYFTSEAEYIPESYEFKVFNDLDELYNAIVFSVDFVKVF